jgi:hypothetical protein
MFHVGRRSLQSGPAVAPLDAPVPLAAVLGLLVAMTLKHYVADFLLQTTWMVRGKEARAGWLAPLGLHLLCHAGLTLAVALAFKPALWWLALADLAVHGLVDRAKALACRRGGWDPSRREFWWLLGFDQLLHQLTNIALAAAFVML